MNGLIGLILGVSTTPAIIESRFAPEIPAYVSSAELPVYPREPIVNTPESVRIKTAKPSYDPHGTAALTIAVKMQSMRDYVRLNADRCPSNYVVRLSI